LGGQSLKADLAFEQTTNPAGDKLVRVAVSNAELTFTAGGAPVASITQASGDMVFIAGKFAGSFSGTVALTIPGVALNGSLNLQINTTGADVDQEFRAGGETRRLTLPGPSYLRLP